ncbi:MAG: hypothetical protein ABSF71_14020 [Terriglobia bacterium]|jgi:hypothetical protein
MGSDNQNPEVVLKRLGKVHWSKAADAFLVETELGAILQLCPNSDDDIGAGVHIDEINVPKDLRGNRRATKAMIALCRLADEFNFKLKGGPVGWDDDPWGEKFVAWVTRLGFRRDPCPPTKVHDRTAFYARRLPRPFKENLRRL